MNFNIWSSRFQGLAILALLAGCGGQSDKAAEGTKPTTAPTAVPAADDSEKAAAPAEAAPEAAAAEKAVEPGGEQAPTGTAEAAPVPEAATGACNEFSKKICSAAGEESESCGAVKGAMVFFSDRACTVAMEDLGDVEAKLADVKKVCTQLVDKLCADVGPDTKTCAMVKEKTPEFPVSRCQQMMEKYDEVVGELRRMEKMNQPLSAEEQAKLVAGNSPSWGPADAKVTVVEFSDFECPYCSKAAEVEQQLKAKYADKVRFVFRQFPLSFHKNAMPAAIASLEAHEQGKFWEVHDALFAKQRELTRENIEAIGEAAGLDMAKFKAALDEQKHKAAVDADMQLGQEVGVQGTPSLFINGERVANPSDFEAVAKAIDEALTK